MHAHEHERPRPLALLQHRATRIAINENETNGTYRHPMALHTAMRHITATVSGSRKEMKKRLRSSGVSLNVHFSYTHIHTTTSTNVVWIFTSIKHTHTHTQIYPYTTACSKIYLATRCLHASSGSVWWWRRVQQTAGCW